MRVWKREKYKLPKTYKEVCKRKRLFMKLLGIARGEKQRKVYEGAVNHCDRLTARITEKARRCAGLVLALFVLLSLSGCIENTMRGAGRMIQGTGELIGGVGKDVVRGTDGYASQR